MTDDTHPARWRMLALLSVAVLLVVRRSMAITSCFFDAERVPTGVVPAVVRYLRERLQEVTTDVEGEEIVGALLAVHCRAGGGDVGALTLADYARLVTLVGTDDVHACAGRPCRVHALLCAAVASPELPAGAAPLVLAAGRPFLCVLEEGEEGVLALLANTAVSIEEAVLIARALDPREFTLAAWGDRAARGTRPASGPGGAASRSRGPERAGAAVLVRGDAMFREHIRFLLDRSPRHALVEIETRASDVARLIELGELLPILKLKSVQQRRSAIGVLRH